MLEKIDLSKKMKKPEYKEKIQELFSQARRTATGVQDKEYSGHDCF